MAGTTLEVDFDTSPLQDALNRVLTAGQDMSRPMAEIANHLERSTRERFDNEESPDGTPWLPVTAKTQKQKNKGYSAGKGQRDQLPTPGKILHGVSLHLRDAIFPFSDRDEAGLHTGAEVDAYAATHQFGSDKRNIPARPFLGFSTDDELAILEILRDHLSPSGSL